MQKALRGRSLADPDRCWEIPFPPTMLPFLKRSDRIMAVPTPHAREWGVAILSYRYSGDRRYQNGQNVLRQSPLQ